MKLSRESILSYIRLQQNKYYDEAKKHPDVSPAYKENLDYAYALLLLLRDLQEMEND